MPRGLPIILATGLVTLLTVPRLPPGPCFDDSGDLQAAAATLGIAHPPGYPLYALAGHVLIRGNAWWSPAYTITFWCCAAMLAALLICGLLQLRLGAEPSIAAASVLLLATHPSVICALLAPEVYAPTLALLAGAALLLTPAAPVAAPRRRAWRPITAMLLLSAAMVSRPPLLLALPACLPALARAMPGGRRWAIGAGMTLAALLPPAVAVAYVLVRDSPANPYNYLERYAEGTGALPAMAASAGARIERAHWLLSGRQHASALVGEPNAIAARAAIVVRAALPAPVWLALPLAGVVLLGLVRLAQRDRPAAWLLGGLPVAALAWLLVFDVPGTAADLLPVLWPGAAALGLGCSELLTPAASHNRSGPPGRYGVRRWLAVLLAAAAAGGAVWALARPAPIVVDVDARPWLGRLDLASLPKGAIVLSAWRESPPLWYAQLVDRVGTSVRIINAPPDTWPAIAERIAHAREKDGPHVFVVREIEPPPGWTLREFRSAWELVPAGEPGQ